MGKAERCVQCKGKNLEHQTSTGPVMCWECGTIWDQNGNILWAKDEPNDRDRRSVEKTTLQ